MPFCPNCGRNQAENAIYCWNCAFKQPTHLTFSNPDAVKNPVTDMPSLIKENPLSLENRKQLDDLKVMFTSKMTKMEGMRKILKPAKPNLPTKELSIRFLTKSLTRMEKCFPDQNGTKLGYISIQVCEQSVAADWINRVAERFTSSVDMQPHVPDGTSYKPVSQTFSFTDLKKMYRRKKCSSKKYGIFMKTSKTRRQLMKSFKVTSDETPSTSSNVQGATFKKRDQSAIDEPWSSDFEDFEESNETLAKADTLDDVDRTNIAILVDLCEEEEEEKKEEKEEEKEQEKEEEKEEEDKEASMVSESGAQDTVNMEEIINIQNEEVLKKKKHRHAICSDIHIDPPMEDSIEFIVVLEDIGFSIQKEFNPSDRLQDLYVWVCTEISPEVLPAKFFLGCLESNNCSEFGCEHRYALEGDNGQKSIALIPKVLIIKEEIYNLNETLTNYDDVLFKID